MFGRIGPYEVLGVLGRGGMATVFRARGPDGAVVALKVLARARSSEGTTRLEREQRLMGDLGAAEGFVPLLATGEAREGLWLAMPLLEGGSLRARLEAGEGMAPEAVRALGVRLARALGAAHRSGIVHRDVKPENVLFSVFVVKLAWPKPLRRARSLGRRVLKILFAKAS